jgi:hypothetical protein
MKEELTKDMEKLRKKYQTETKNRVEVHSSRLEQAEDRISEFKDEIEIKEKTEEIIVKQLKSCEQNMQEPSYSNRRPNMRIVGIEEGEEVQAKGIHNIFNKIIENFTNLKKALHIQVQESSRTPNRCNQNRTSPQHVITKTTSTENREGILKVVRQKKQTTYKGKHIQITAYFLTETLKVRRAWSEVFWVPNENNFNLRILYPAKLSFKIDRA